MRRWQLQALGLAVSALAGCVEVVPTAVMQPRFLGAESVEQDGPRGAYAGLDLEESFAGSLEELSFLPGLEVHRVHEGSPAARAGLRAGDRVVSVDGAELSGLDQWAAILAAGAPEAGLALQVERDQAIHQVVLELADATNGRLSASTRWVERLKARAMFDSLSAADHRVHAVLAETLADSPLDGEVPDGARILAVDGVTITGAQHLAKWFAEAEFGRSVEIEYDVGEGPRTAKVDLWSPPRRVTRVRVPILFDFECSADGEESSLRLIDLWLISLFGYERDGPTKAWSVLRWLRFETGTGELTEVESETRP